jgi:exopolysaccharide biosynthesis polyprenyl glycosylphosphotransferase
MIIVYDGKEANRIVKKMATRKEKYQVCASIKATEEYSKVCEKIKRYDSVILCDVSPELRNKLIQFCFDNSIRAYVTANIADILIRGAENIIINDTPLLLCKSRGLTVEQRFVKRIIDIFISLVGIILSSPIMLITAIAIKVYDGGPVLYKQVRTTRNGRDFKIWKFRSMIVDAEKASGARLASSNDSRITPVGNVIRRYRIDELPQMFNILFGDMSVVGPRPERPEIIKEYLENMPEFKYRLKVKAGLTGYAQVLGKYNTTPKDKLKMDMIYIENYSVLMDLKLIMMTLKIMFVKESTEGVGEDGKAE